MQQPSSFLLQGGTDLVTPPIAMPPGRATAALNYESDVRGYRRFAGYERFDGRTSPSAGGTRSLIQAVPGSGAVRGVWVYRNELYAFRDTADGGQGAMYKATAAGWVLQTHTSVTLDFNAGSVQFVEGGTLSGGTSAATGTIQRVITRSGNWSAAPNNTAAGYLVLSGVTGTFTVGETITGSTGGSATCSVSQQPVTLPNGGPYEFATHNFYGATKSPRMYFCNGVGPAFEWDGTVLAPIRSGNDAGTLDSIVQVLNRTASPNKILTRDGSRVVARGQHDRPSRIGVFRNHLFLGFRAGALIHSGTGEPLDYRVISGAGEIAFGSEPTGFLTSASTAFVIFGRDRIEYLTGNDTTDFVMVPITDAAGAFEFTAQNADKPIYLDDAGVRKLDTTQAFGDWRLGTLTQLVQPLLLAKRAAGTLPTASMRVKDKDLYRLFFDDNSVLSLYLGRKQPEAMILSLPIDINCACAGEIDAGMGERVFVGAADGMVYELDKGTSFDGAEIQAYIRFAWNDLRAPSVNKRFHRIAVETDGDDAMEIGVSFEVDYGINGNVGGSRTDYTVDGSPAEFLGADYDTIDWGVPDMGLLEADLDGVGTNVAVTLVTEHTTEAPHTLPSATLYFSPRGMKKTR